jgi:hypothetical protein
MKVQRPECKLVSPGDQLRSFVKSGQRGKRFFSLRIPAKATTAPHERICCYHPVWGDHVVDRRRDASSLQTVVYTFACCFRGPSQALEDQTDSPPFRFVMVLHPGKLWWPLRLMPYGRAGRGSDSGVSSCICRKRAWKKKQQTRSSKDWHVILHCH